MLEARESDQRDDLTCTILQGTSLSHPYAEGDNESRLMSRVRLQKDFESQKNSCSLLTAGPFLHTVCMLRSRELRSLRITESVMRSAGSSQSYNSSRENTGQYPLVLRDVLIDGGNAIDAAIATLVCVGVTNPQSSGLGGGMLMTIYNA